MSFKTSIIKLDKKRKIQMLLNALCIKLAKQANDPLYEKYAQTRRKYLELKARLIEKYLPKAKVALRKILANKKK